MAKLDEVVNRAIADFDSIKSNMMQSEIQVEDGTNTSEYGKLIKYQYDEVKTALDNIIAIQNSLIGGDSV